MHFLYLGFSSRVWKRAPDRRADGVGAEIDPNCRRRASSSLLPLLTNDSDPTGQLFSIDLRRMLMRDRLSNIDVRPRVNIYTRMSLEKASQQ